MLQDLYVCVELSDEMQRTQDLGRLRLPVAEMLAR